MSEEINYKALQRRIKQHIKAKQHGFFAVVQPGFEATALRELEALGAGSEHRLTEGGVEFTGTLEDCYRCNLCSRGVTRILMRLGRFRAENFHRFHESMSKIPWELHIADKRELSFSISAAKSRLYHTGRLAEECALAVTERLARYGLTPSITEKPVSGAQTVSVRMDHDICHVSLDSSGEMLYRRGQKTLVTEAPLRETLAALILTEARLEEYDVLIDPMCGSGTFSIEAAEIAAHRPAGTDRNFSFMQWPVFSGAAFNHMKKELLGETENRGRILTVLASDIDKGAVKIASENISASGLQEIISVSELDLFTGAVTLPEGGRCLIVLNPPYGGRLRAGNVQSFYRKIGAVIRERYPDCGYAVIVPGLETEKAMGLPHDRKITFMNGGIPVAVIFRDADPRPGA